MSVWQAARTADAVLTRTVTGAILAPHETQRLVVSDKTGTYSSRSPGKSKCGPIDYGRRNGDPFMGVVIVCDGSIEADERIGRVLWNDPASGIMRHADAGYEVAVECAGEMRLKLPMV